MKVIRNRFEMTEISEFYKKQGLKLGFVPTMGSLHEGHVSLFRHIENKCHAVAASIYVNPKQFCPGEDFERYPRDEKNDLKMLEGVCDYVFIPDDKEIYPQGFSTSVEVGNLAERLCGLKRPGHFKGVTTVVARLFGIIKPSVSAFGQKDYQQFMIIKRMVEDLALGVELVMCPIVREKDGLAMSSRNRYLSGEDREKALSLRKALLAGKKETETGEENPLKIKKIMLDVLSGCGVETDYAEIVHPLTLEPLRKKEGKMLLVVAAFVGKTRLIDNEIIDRKEK